MDCTNVATAKPTVLYICVANAGKSQMAEAITHARYGDEIRATSAGTKPKVQINAESAASVAEIGASMNGAIPKAIDESLLRDADRVIVIGSSAQVDFPPDAKGTIDRWITDEPSERGIEGTERMRLIRDDIASRVDKLADELLDANAQHDLDA